MNRLILTLGLIVILLPLAPLLALGSLAAHLTTLVEYAETSPPVGLNGLPRPLPLYPLLAPSPDFLPGYWGSAAGL